MKVSHDLFGIVDHRDGMKYVAVFDEQVGPKNSDHTISFLLHYPHHCGLVPSWVRCVRIFLDNAASTNKNRYVLGWSMELVQHHVMDLVRISFLITSHTKFAPDRVFASIGRSYNHCDVNELVAVAGRFSTAVKEAGVNVLHWRQELDKKYTDLSGIRKYHDFHVTRNADGNAQLQVREDCGSGELLASRLTRRKTVTSQVQCFPDVSLNYFTSKRDISRENISDMHTMYSRFIDQERWPKNLHVSQPQQFF